MKQRKYIVTAMVFLVCSLGLFKLQAEAGTLYESPYVTFSPDNFAWTVAEEVPYTDSFLNYSFPDNAPEYWYAKDTVHDTGIESTLRPLAVGEHYYKYERRGEVPVGKWVVKNATGMCIHNCDTPVWSGVVNVGGGTKCGNAYYSGWFPYCADCGELIKYAYMYMSKDAVATITSIDVDKGYYYSCPTCGHLDLTAGYDAHKCKTISWNKYLVRYDANDTLLLRDASGAMTESYHMYNNATTYEGETVTPITHLNRNNYFVIGYEFIGWNTKPDGSGTFYADEAEIFNLTSYDCKMDGALGEVILYAQWKESNSTLCIDPAGGTYNGSSSVTSITQGYMSQYVVDDSKLTVPDGCTISFQANGGTALNGGTISPITGTQQFSWSKVAPFRGLFINNIYTFLAQDGNMDTIRAVYTQDPITLPGAKKPGASFGGWYYDAAFTKPAGGAGDRIIPTGNMTLYAQWVDLTLYSKDNYTANNRKGAVDLSWTQSDGNNKAYKLYQSTDNVNWRQINSAQDIGSALNVTQNHGYTGSEQTYTIPYSGLYTLTTGAAQGGNYESFTGGLGGRVSGTFYLKAGDVIKYQIGGQGDTATGGGSGTAGGNGGGYTKVSRISGGVETLLLMAGGGSGATSAKNGNPGGTSDFLREDGVSTGRDGISGGGGGYVGGGAYN